MDITFLYNCKGACYPLSLPSDVGMYNKKIEVKPLVDICAENIVHDATMTQKCMEDVPTDLYFNLMRAALMKERDRAISVIMAKWPWHVMTLRRFIPEVPDDLKMLYKESVIAKIMSSRIKYTTYLVTSFLECLKKRTPTNLKVLDLSGFPTAEIIIHYLSSHTLLISNETKQKEIIKLYNEATDILPELKTTEFTVDDTLPEGCFTVKADIFLKSEDIFIEFLKAVQVPKESNFRILVNKLDVSCLGEQFLTELFGHIDRERVSSLRLQYNSLTCSSLYRLGPLLEDFKNIVSLDLTSNGFVFINSRSSCAPMQRILQNLPNLRRLDLSNNWIRNTLSQLLSEVVKPLEYIGLACCCIRPPDVRYLSTSHHMAALQHLDLSDNNLYAASDYLIDLVKACKGSLRILELECCKFQNLFLAQMANASPLLTELFFLNISHNNFSQLTCFALFSDLICAHSLRVIRLSIPEDLLIPTEFDTDVTIKARVTKFGEALEALRVKHSPNVQVVISTPSVD